MNMIFEPPYDLYTVPPPTAPRLRLYDLPDEFQAVSDALEASEGELTPEIEAKLGALNATLEQKCAAICRLVVEKQAFQRARREASFQEQHQAAIYERAADRLQDYLARSLANLGQYEYEAGGFRISVTPDNDEFGNVYSNIEIDAKCEVVSDPMESYATPTVVGEVQELVQVIRDLQVLVDARAVEIARMEKIQIADEDAIAQAKEMIRTVLEKAGMDRLEMPTFKARIQRNSQPSVRLLGECDPTMLPPEFTIQPPAPPLAVDTKKVREAWKAAGQPEELVVWVDQSAKEVIEANGGEVAMKYGQLVVALGKHVRVA